MNSKNKKKLFLFNSVTGVVQLLLTMILVFFSIPIFIKNLGDIQYGIFCAVAVIGNLSTFANLSLDATLIKYISEQGKTQESDYDIVTSFLLLTIILLPLSIVIFLFREFILLNVVKVPIEFLSVSSVFLVYLLAANFFLLLGKIFTAVLDANHKIYLTNLYLFIYTVFYWGCVIVLVLAGYGLEQIGISIFCSALLWFVLVMYSATKIWGKFNIDGLRYHFKRIVKKQLSYSTKIYIGSLFAFLFEPLTKILISNLVGISYVGLYEITLKVKNNLLAIFLKFLYPLYPFIAHENDHDKLRIQIARTSKILFYLIIPIIVTVIICTKSIMTLWIGGENIPILTISTIIIVCFSLLLSTTVTPIYIFLRLKNHPEKEIYMQALNAGVNILIIILFFRYLGYASIILGNTLTLIAPFSLCIYYQKKYVQSYPFSGMRDLLKYMSSFVLIGVITWLFSFFFQSVNWGNIIIVTLFSCVASIIIFYFMRAIKNEDIKYFYIHIFKK
jgi:O-antigen/teichoic acid export membrane protein